MRTWSSCILLLAIVALLTACDEVDSGGGCCATSGPALPTLQVTTTTLPACGYNATYLETLTAANGTQPYTWSLVSGTLPGIMEVTISGELVGNPLLNYGTFSFRVRVTDSVAATAEQDLTLDVAAPPPPPTYYSDPVVGKFVYAIDFSAQSATVDAGKSQSRLQRSIAEVQASLATLNSPYDKFEILAFGNNGVTRCFGSLQYNTSGIAAMAQNFMASLAPAGDAATYSALRAAHLDYGTGLHLVQFFVSSTPGADLGAPGGVATFTNILADSPTWFANQFTWTLAVRDAVGTGTITSFAQSLAALAGGTYTPVP